MATKKELRAWKDACWEFMLEHCDQRSGGIFVKFFAENKADFEKRVYARLKDYYHRDREGNPIRKKQHLLKVSDRLGKEIARDRAPKELDEPEDMLE